MTTYEIPLSAQSQTLQVNLGGAFYRLALTWRDTAGGWFLDISDAGGNPLIGGMPLVTGANLLEQFAHIGIPGQLWVQSDGNAPDALPAYENLGADSHLYWVTT